MRGGGREPRHRPTGSLWGHGHFYGNGGERPLFRQGSSMFTPRGAPQPHASHGVGETHQGARSLEGWPEPCVARDPQGLEPRGPGRPGCSRQRLGHQMLGHREASGLPRPGRARHMNNECALPPLISILDQRHRPALRFHSWLQRRSTARARTEEGDEGRWSPGVCVCGGVPRTPKVKSPKTSGCRTHRHRGRSAGRRSGSRAPTEPAPGSVPQRETRLETVATGPSEAHPARPLSSASAPEVALRHLLSL